MNEVMAYGAVAGILGFCVWLYWMSRRMDIMPSDEYEWLVREQGELIQRMDKLETAALVAGDESAMVDDINLLKARLLALERNAPDKGAQAARGVVSARRMVEAFGGAKDIQ